MKRKTSGKATKRAGHKKIATGYKVSDLAKAFGITAKTIYHLRAKHKGPLSSDPAEWAEYLERRALATGASQSIELGTKDYQKLRLKLLRAQVGKEEAIRKLKELELERQSQNLVPMAEAKEAIRKFLCHSGNCSKGCQRRSPFRQIPQIRKWQSKQLKRHWTTYSG